MVQDAKLEIAGGGERKAEALPGLSVGNFRRVARNGLGDPENVYFHSMEWFQDHLFASTTRNVMTAPRPFAEDLESVFSIYPVKVPSTNPWDNDFRAQIWRYDPRADAWRKVHTSPMFTGKLGFEVPRQIGFRCMTTFQGRSDSAPALYAASWATRMGPGPFILRCSNGEDFEEVSEPGLGALSSQTIRALVSFKGRLFAASCARGGSRDVTPDLLAVFESDDPARGQWRLVCEPSFGNPRNLVIGEMAVFAGHLYAGTLNPYNGFEVFKTDAEGEPPYRWKRVLAGGAYRGKLNEWVASMCVFDGCLYIGGAIQHCGHDRIYHVGPAAPEIIRLYPDDSWELVVGIPRSTPDGPKVPLSGMGPGFDYALAGYIWRLCEHEGWLYATTAEKTGFLPFVSPIRLQRFGGPDSSEQLWLRCGGFDLWRTRDGVNWVPVTRNGFGNPFNLGGRTLVSTPAGLFVGTANLFGRQVAVKRTAGWFYEPNPEGGAEAWLGSRHYCADRNAGDSATAAAQDRAVELRGGTGSEPCAVHTRLLQEFYGGSDFRHFGYWGPRTQDPKTACASLMEELLAFTRPVAEFRIPKPATDEEDLRFFATRSTKSDRVSAAAGATLIHKRILDIGCGLGATTGYLLRCFPPDSVTGVTGDKRHLAACRRNAPGACLRAMNLLKLDFAEHSFDLAIAVESLASCGDREGLLRQVLRVLKAGGQFVGADILAAEQSPTQRPRLRRGPAVTDPRQYEQLLLSLGFGEVRVEEVTAQCWLPFRRSTTLFIQSKLACRGIDGNVLEALRSSWPGADLVVGHYVLVSAKKPGGGDPG